MRRPPWLEPVDSIEAARAKAQCIAQFRAALKRRRDAGLRRRHAHKEQPPAEQTGGSNQHNTRSIP